MSFGLFALFLGIHVAIWRFHHPKQHALALIVILLLVLIVFLIISTGSFQLPLIDIAAISLLYVALSCAYIQIYPASQADSPSLRILLIVDQNKTRGLSEGEIKTFFTSKSLLDDRINDLLHSGLISKTNQQEFTLTKKGKILILPFIVLRNLIGLPKGNG